MIFLYAIFVSNKYFKKMVYKIIHAPINLFFDTTPSGWILNRFSKDIEKLDEEIGQSLYDLIDCSTAICIMFYVMGSNSMWMLLVVPFATVLVFVIVIYYI